jgi:hypothetical protein
MHLFVKTETSTVTMMVETSDTLETILMKIYAKEGIYPDTIVFSVGKQEDEEERTVHSTPVFASSGELDERQSDPLWTPGSICDSQEQRKIDDDQLFLVRFDALRSLFSTCRKPGCEAAVHENDTEVVTKGAGLKISTLCANHHLTKWQSAEFFNDVSEYGISSNNWGQKGHFNKHQHTNKHTFHA